MSVAHLSDVDAWRASAQRPTIAQQHVWGPVSTRIAALAGSARGAKSVCIAPHLPQMSVAAALGCIPADLRPRTTDTADTLAERIGRSVFLDDAHPLRGGSGKRKRNQSMRIRLNARVSLLPAAHALVGTV